MKKLFLVLFTLTASLASYAQNAEIDLFFQKYEGKEGFTSINVSEKLFAIIASATSDDLELQSIVEGLKGIKVLVYENESGTSESGVYYKELANSLPLSSYDELMSINSDTEKVRILAKMDSEKILSELLIICDADGEFVLVSIIGLIDFEKISKLSEMDFNGMDELKKIENK